MRVKSAFSASELCHAKHKNVSIKTLKPLIYKKSPAISTDCRAFRLVPVAGLEPSMIAVKRLELLGEFLRDKFRGKIT